MQIETYDKNLLVSLINDAGSIAIIPSKVAGCDSFCAGAGLFYMLREKYAHENPQKIIKFIYSGKTPVLCEKAIKPEDVSANLSQRELEVAIDYSDTPASKITYATDNDVLLLRMGPVNADFDIERKIRARVTGFDFDLIITVGALELNDLGVIYTNLKDEIERAKIINIDNTNKNMRYGVVNVIDTGSTNLSSLIFKKAVDWDLEPNDSSAKALLAGMSYRDNGGK